MLHLRSFSTLALLLCGALHTHAHAQSTTPSMTPKPAAGEGGSVTTASGLIYRSITEGKGNSPAATDNVKVHYRGTFMDGREFDSSYTRGKPAVFRLNGVIKCWTEGVQRMKVGGKAKLSCPAAIAYGEKGTPGGPIPPNATLNFEVELLAINP